MRRGTAAALAALSIALGLGTVVLVALLHGGQATARTPRPRSATDPAATGAPAHHTQDVAPAPTVPTGSDGKPLEVGPIVPGGIEPVMVGDRVSDHVRAGYLVVDRDPPCEGTHWRWAGRLSTSLDVAATPAGTITGLGTRTGLVKAVRVGVGSTLTDLKQAYGELLDPVEADDQGVGWASVTEHDRWIAFSLGRADKVTGNSRVDYVEVGVGPVLHRFNDAC